RRSGVDDDTAPTPPQSASRKPPIASWSAASPPPEQAANLADNSRATKGGQMTRYGHGKLCRLARGHDLRLKSLLRRLGPEIDEGRRRQHRGDDLAAGRLERGDLRREVLRHGVEPTRVDELV